MILWDFASVETRGFGQSPILEGLGGGRSPPAKTNYNWFYIFQNCIIHNFGRMLNSLAILFTDAMHRLHPGESRECLYEQCGKALKNARDWDGGRSERRDASLVSSDSTRSSSSASTDTV